MDKAMIEEMLSDAIRDPGKIESVEELGGDASTRRYFRIVFKEGEGGGNSSMILMRYPLDHIEEGELPFLNVHRYLHDAGVPVPVVYLHMPGANLLFLEDGGDMTLEGAVDQMGFNPSIENIYHKAMDIIVRIQVEGTSRLDSSSISGKLAFHREKFMEEMDFLYKWGLSKQVPGIAKKMKREEFLGLVDPVVETLVSLPKVLVHRDYHSRNIMVMDEGRRVMILDFQDARMGNIYYDPASLLFDSYVQLPGNLRRDLMKGYAERVRGESFVSFSSFDECYRNLLTMAVQRNLKALGTFFYMYLGKGIDRYLTYVEGTIDYLKENPVLEEEYGKLSKKVIPFLEEIASWLPVNGGREIERDDSRGRPGDKT